MNYILRKEIGFFCSNLMATGVKRNKGMLLNSWVGYGQPCLPEKQEKN